MKQQLINSTSAFLFILILLQWTHSTLIVSRISPTNNQFDSPYSSTKNTHHGDINLPVVIWHGLSDTYQNPGLLVLAHQIQQRYPATFVYLIRLHDSESQDRRATFFGSANDQVRSVCHQLSRIDELAVGFDAVGMSQGGQLLRAYVERCNKPRVRNLITLGSQHMGVSGASPCTSLFDLGCHMLHHLIESGTVYGRYAQQHVIPAQYFRDQTNLEPYMKHNEFLRDINNERWNDTQPPDSGSSSSNRKNSHDDDLLSDQPRNQTYKHNLESLNNFVMFQFSAENMVIPPTSAFFTLPNLTASRMLDTLDPIPIAMQDLPIYQEDYIGLKTLDEAGKIHYGTCFGVHMQIDHECWNNVMDWLGDGLHRITSDHSSSQTNNIFRQEKQILFSY